MFNSLLKSIKSTQFGKASGRVTRYSGLMAEASGLEVFVGERCEIFSEDHHQTILAEVIGFIENKTLLMPIGKGEGITLNSRVIGLGVKSMVKVGHELLGRTIDAFVNPIDDLGALKCTSLAPLRRDKRHNPLSRERVDYRVSTSVPIIDTMLPIGRGQRIGVFAGSGVGKSTILGQCANADPDQINVVALIGERGREVADFIEDNLGQEGLSRSVVIVATSDEPPLVRRCAVFTALAIAEYFCEQNKNVLLTLDSITRFAMAQREIGLAAGEPPTSKGYTPSVFSMLPEVVERTGNFKGKGSITALFSVLVEGDDLSEPIADAMRGILDGHIVLSRKMASKGLYPAVDVLMSNSRLWHRVSSIEEQNVVNQLRTHLSDKKDVEEMIEIGAYKSNENADLDLAYKKGKLIESYLLSKRNENKSLQRLYSDLQGILNDAG
ncbi:MULTISPECIES: FliI/YscN family ATPase [unclassified Agarivorans]|uniref:FliI/YscN family ATPase n=1 Tax=unclassified Agarivorans TaxID=2636026 RepID=UPI0026E216CB|nr:MULTISPECIES: FliI/YscN family ATPase [unclassified Agarivorans]MDO6685856.1 FliI/YscN family ATPase [Agarivorans sp. 3_MG-2023]MDO6716029.1 FliI/YscN family ATPase [Agarivorans sp. 2_MG-2023]